MELVHDELDVTIVVGVAVVVAIDDDDDWIGIITLGVKIPDDATRCWLCCSSGRVRRVSLPLGDCGATVRL